MQWNRLKIRTLNRLRYLFPCQLVMCGGSMRRRWQDDNPMGIPEQVFIPLQRAPVSERKCMRFENHRQATIRIGVANSIDARLQLGL